MCTIICKYNYSGEYKALFLVNRDRPLEGFKGNDVRIITPGHLLCIFDHRSQGIAAGFSLNSGLFGAVANVIGYVGIKSRGQALRDVLTKATNLDEAVELLAELLRTGTYSSARYLIATANQGYIVENFNQELNLQRFDDEVVITNRFEHLSFGREQPEAADRERYVREQLSRGNLMIEDMMKIAKNHDSGHPVCRHNLTVASLLVAIQRSTNIAEEYYAVGHPCRGFQRFLMV